MAKNYFADEPMPTLFTPTVEPVTKQNSQGLFGDAVDTFQSNIFTSLGGVFDFVGADGLAKSMRENSEEQYTEVSQQGKDALAKEFVSEDERGNITLGEGATDLDTWLLTMASVAGQFAGTAIPGAGAAGLAGKAASLGAKGKNIANIASMGATGGAAATGQGMEQARQEVQNMPDTLLAESPLFGDVFRGVHANQPELSNVEKWEAAKTALANKVAQEARTDPKVLLANFGASAIGDPIIGKALTGARLAKSGALRSALAGFVTEGSTEAVQAGVQQLGVNQALQPIDNRDEMQGVVAAGLNEGLAGGGFGAAAGGIGGLVNRQPKQQTPQTEPTAEPAPQPAVDPVTEQMKASNPNLGEAMASMDQHSTNVKSEVDNLKTPIKEPEYIAPISDNAQLDRIASAAESMKTVKAKQNTKAFLEAEKARLQQAEIDRSEAARSIIADATNYLNTSRTPNLTDSNQVLDQQNALQIEQSTQQETFAGNESGVNVARNGKPFKSMKEARNSKLARQAKRQGLTVDVVPFDNGYGWMVNSNNQESAPISAPITETNAQPTANLAGDPIDSEWTAFSEQSETKNIPRAEMPQIKAENRGAMVNFMNARDISHEQDEVPASSLKPTQQEFSPAKVKKAMEFEGGNRSILVSSDNYVLDGHHQWLAAREKGEPVKVIRLNAPIEQLVPLAKEMPSTETQDNTGKLISDGNEETADTGKLNGDNGKQSEQKAAETAETGKLIEQEPVTTEQANQLPSILKTTKRKWLQSEAKKLGLKKGSPGYDAAVAKIEESYEPAIDKALAESSFETYQEFNSDTPESINRQAYSELRKEFGLDDQPIEKPQEQKTVQANDTESPNSSENKKVDDPVAAEPEANEQQSSTNQATVKQESINDFGEKLGGARKDVWSGFSEAIQDQQSTAELPLGKAWPEPNYKELVDNGASVESVALMAAMRSEVPAKPRLSYKVSRWAEKVNTLKSFAADLMNGDRDVESVMQRMRNHSSKLAAIVDAIPSIAKADLDTLKSVADYRINSGSFSIFGGKTYSPSKVFYFIERNGRPVYDGASETLSDVQALLTKVIKAEQADSSSATSGKKSKISVYRDRYTKDIYLGWKGASGVLKIKSFNDLSAAREYLKNNRDEVEQTLQKMKETPSMRKPVNAERMGPERYAENVTPDTFGETFGFRGVEFGNWVEQAKRQKDLNQAYDGLMDLAEALDLEPKALSLNGKLGLAFGARGKGGKNPAAAHYEPNSVVINLTKKAGSGSLAHEWWHALDNYFGKQKTKGEFITESPYSMSSDEIRPEMASAFKHVKSAIAQSGLPERSRELDTRRSKAYWATPVEMTARSFETYIIDKLNQQGITNDYLANVVGDEAWTAAESLGFESDNTYPYPNKAEQEKINPAYQTLFDTVESENTSEGIRLFSKSKKPTSSKSISTEQAQRIADQFVKDLKGANGITVSILDDTATAEKLWRMSLDGATVKGAYSELSKTVYIIAENINDLTDLKQTLAHETIAHGGLDTVIGAEAKQAFIDRIKKTKGRKAFEKYWKDANNDYWDMSDNVKAEEIFARFVENEPSKGELKYWWNALKRWIKAQLDKAGIMYREDDELTAMREMLESIVKGFKAQREPMVSSQAEMTYSQSDKKFSRTADNDTRTAKQKLGLEEQVRETIADRAKEKVNETVDTLKSSSFWQRLNEGIFDGLAGIKQAEVSAGVTDPNKQGYVSARLASGLADVLHGVFNYGAPVWKDGIIQRKENTKGLLEVFGMVGDDLNNWLAWMGAKRAEKLKEQGRENNLTQADIDELKALANGKEELFEQVRQEYNKVNSAILDVAQGAGLLSEEQRASFDEEYYVPFFRDMGETDAELDDIKRMIVEPHMRKGIASQSAKIKELKGGKQSTKDLLENIIARQSTLIDASLKNKAMQEVTDNLDGTDYMQAETSEEIASLSQQELNKLHRVKVMRNGKAQAYMVSDPALLRALIQVNDVGSQSLFNKMGRSAKRFLTAGITLSPDFIFKNFVRDAAHAWMINKDDFKFGTDSIKGLKKAFKEDEAYRDLIFSGAAFQGGYIHGADPEAAAQQTRRALRSKGLTTNEIDGYLDTVVNSGAELLEKYRGISDKVENANRLSTYEAALAAGKSKRQAAYEAKDLMDYSLKGNFKLIGTMIDMLPFFNARLQGMSKLVRAAKAGDGDRVLKVLSANLAMKGIKVAGFSLALAAMNDDDERYQELPDWDKDMNWHIFAGDQHFRIPKPFELGIIFGTLPERMLHTATGTQTGGDLGKAVANAVFNTLALNPIPQFALPATEVLVNKSFFKDAPIEGMADENKQAEDRYNTYTSEVAKGIGSTFGVSPKKVEHLIKGYTGTIGGYVLGASDIVARQIMGKETADTPVSRYPVIKAFYQGSGPKGSTKFANDFYESLEAANQAYGSYKRAMEIGDTSRQQELIEGAGDKLRSRIALGRVQRAASKLGKMARAVNDNPNLTGEQKRKQLDDIQRQKNALYHQAYVTFNLGEW
ncbi:LPD38 domain-containing protein [Pseudoalteromonas tetraodonis]|uniref:LPD38 domain-containing protein n=1 Tax=Pseudoalteromonas tetraodonis TaxID=43659 RepID=UPI003A975DE8